MEYAVGDIVRLRSGGPLMTVDYVVGTGDDDSLLYEEGFAYGDVVCQWFNGTALHARCFKPSVLIKPALA